MKDTQKLFLIYVGGTAPGANIELHDVRFVVAPDIESTYPAIRKQWFGSQKGIHLDSYVHVHHVDGYRLELRSEAPSKTPAKRLYFVNFGGYFPNQLAEYHAFTLVVADSKENAKQLAKAQVMRQGLKGAEQLHKDDLLEVDDCLTLELIDHYYIDLIHDGQVQELVPDWKGYQPLP